MKKKIPTFKNQVRVAIAMESGSHSGASRQCSMSPIIRATPSSNVTMVFHPSLLRILPLSAKVQSGSPGRFGT
jgi:hypothetical protein